MWVFISLKEKKKRQNQNMEEKWEQNLTLRGDLVLIFLVCNRYIFISVAYTRK